MNQNVFRVIETVVHVYHRLTAAGDLIHADRALTTGMRSLMMGLATSGPRTVARMADDRPVSRQYIQRLVDDLLEKGLVRARPNPEHKRSVLIDLTPAGRRMTDAIARIEAPLIEELFGGFSDRELAITARVLSTLTERLSPDALKQLGPETPILSSERQE
jgi:DNA-binding MarR family transcriptional regulator